MELTEKSLLTLELPAVLEFLSKEAVSAPAKEKVMELRPLPSKYQVMSRLGETSAAKAMIQLKGSPSFSGITDIRSSLARADMGGMLNTRELLDIARVLTAARQAKSYAGGEGCGRTDLDFLFHTLTANRFLEDKIVNSIIGEDEIADGASSELASIRRQMRACASRVREALQKIISSPSYAKALQEPIITMRSERYVVPVKAEHKGSIQGLVHDISSSGATLFIEPLAAVKANNELRELSAKEKVEIDRILMELSADCAGHGEDIKRDFESLVDLDLIFARARYSYKINAQEPELSDGEIVLNKARHPLLALDKAVPIDIELGTDYDTMVITGPNTGGKTVSLKTLGLLCLMTQCGLHIPVADGSCIPVYEQILADIGDEQSIEQSLSTFSSHMSNIVQILDSCTEKSLLLFDELGAGTDPVEGAALAISIIEYARARGAVIAATTHYAELKVYATSTKGVVNASCEFDVATLRPTYRLLIGIPGKSNAFAIAQRLGINPEIISDAQSRVNAENANFEETLTKLELQRQNMEELRIEAQKALNSARDKEKQSERMRRELSVRLEKADEKANRAAQQVMDEARQAAEKVFAELDEMRKRQEKEESWQMHNQSRAELRRFINETEDSFVAERAPETEKKSARPIKPGDTVEIKSMGIKASVIDVSADRVLTLQAGIMRVSAKEDEVLLLETQQAPEVKSYIEKSKVTFNAAGSKPEIDLRGMSSDEAIPLMERFLDGAVMSKLEVVTIIHGKGTGVLRAAVNQSLKKNRQVKSFRLGRYGEGEDGVTIVELR